VKRSFEIEYPDECGPMWMNEGNLMLCINAYCENKDGRIKAVDITEERDSAQKEFLGLCDLVRRLMDAEDEWTEYDCTINIDKFITPIMERMGQKNAKRTL
jgi:hypothetical protein